MGDYKVQAGNTTLNVTKDKYNSSSSSNKDVLELNSVSIIGAKGTVVLKDETGNKNYYRANSIFGDIATKKEKYPDQEFKESELKKITQATDEVEDVMLNVKGSFASETARDAQGYDIAAKVAGVGGFSQMNGSDAYSMFLKLNKDDFTMRETEYKGKKEVKAYYDQVKSDGVIKGFGSEIINGKEYLTLKDDSGKVHYFDMENKLEEVEL